MFYDLTVHEYGGELPNYNYNTLEPCLLRANNIGVLNSIFGTDHEDEEGILKYMKNNKTKCALKIFETEVDFNAPEYIQRALEFIDA